MWVILVGMGKVKFIGLHSRRKDNRRSLLSPQEATVVAEARIKSDGSYPTVVESSSQEHQRVKGKYGFLVLVGVLALLTYFALITDRLPGDLAIAQWVQSLAGPESLGPIPDLLFWMGEKGVAGALLVPVCVWLWLKGHRTEAVFVALIGSPDLLNIPLRELIDRPRPTTVPLNAFGGGHGASFPSGYALHVLLWGGFLLYLSRSVVKRRAIRTVLWLALGLYIPVTGLWLIYDGRHWPSDVLGGYVYGAFYLTVLIWGYKKYTAWQCRYAAKEFAVTSRPLSWILRVVN